MSQLFEALARLNGNAPERTLDVIRPGPAAASSVGSAPQPRASVAGTSLERRYLEQPERQSVDSVSLNEILSRLWRRRIALLAAAVIGASAMVLIFAMGTPVYRARTAIRLEELNDRFPNLRDIFPVAANAPGEMYFQNELKILQSDALAKRVAIRLGLQPVQRARSLLSRAPLGSLLARFDAGHRSPSADDLLISAVQRALTVRSSLKSQVIEISFDSPDPALAARGTNTVVSEYVAINREARMQTSQDTTEWLAGQIADLKTKLDQGNQELQAFARSSGLLYAANESLLTEESARQIQEQLSKARADRAAKQSRYETAVSNSPEALPAGADSGLLREYEGKLAALQGELTQLRSLYTPAHYKVVDADARAAQLEAAIKEERQRIIGRMRAEYEAANGLEGSLSSMYNAQTRKLAGQTADAFRHNVLKRDLESTQQLYNSLIQKAREAGVASAMHTTSVRVIDVARPPASPYSPNLPLNGAIGFSGGLLLAIGIVLIRDRGAYLADTHPDSRIFDIRELGRIPSAKQSPARGRFAAARNNSNVELVTWHEPPSVLTEAFRATLASILFSPDFERKHGVLTLTSVQPNVGKTTTISNLGIALAETHGRVLLIDADLRRPRIHKIFEHCNDTGLTTVLTSDEPVATLKFDTLIRETSIPGLFTLPSGPGTASITPLLYSARMFTFLARTRKEFDYVLIDTSPTALFSDARILGRLSDAVIIVIHATKTSRAELNTACLNFVKDGTHILGTIVNHWNAADRRGAYKSYRQAEA
jgi:polysaccharide biosynthesis transport protein